MAIAPMAKAPSASAAKASAAGTFGRSAPERDPEKCAAVFRKIARPLNKLKREPVAPVRIGLVMRVHARAQADAVADGRQSDAAAALVVHPQPGDEIEAAFHAGKALEHAPRLAQIVAQGEAFGGVGADIEAHRGTAPEHLQRLDILAHQ